MKKLFLVLSLVATLPSFAGDVRISARSTLGALNKCSDWVYFTVVVSKPTDEPSCEASATSTVIALAPGASLSFSDGNLPSGIAPMPATTTRYYFLSANILDGAGGCATTAARIGETCTNLGQKAVFHPKNSDCKPVGTATATWSTSTDGAMLVFE